MPLPKQFERDTQALALSNFHIAVCKKISGPLPMECSSLPNGAATISIFSTVAAVALSALVLMFKA